MLKEERLKVHAVADQWRKFFARDYYFMSDALSRNKIDRPQTKCLPRRVNHKRSMAYLAIFAIWRHTCRTTVAHSQKVCNARSARCFHPELPCCRAAEDGIYCDAAFGNMLDNEAI